MPPPFWLKTLGAKGEYLARRYFHRRGYHLMARNWRHGHGEIDVIMSNGHHLLFLEVKARRVLRPGDPYELVAKDQKLRLLELARIYTQQLGDEDFCSQFVIAYLAFLPKGRVATQVVPLD